MWMEVQEAMSKRYIVPEEMIVSAMKAAMAAGLPIGPSTEIRIPLEAALRWLSENPAPLSQSTHEELKTQYLVGNNEGDASWSIYHLVWKECQRRMFLAPEPKTPQPIDTPLGRVVFDPRVPKGEIHIGSWDRPLIMGNIGTDK